MKHLDIQNEAPRPQGGASRKGDFVYVVPLNPTCKAGLTGHAPVIERGFLLRRMAFEGSDSRKFTALFVTDERRRP
jgi:hypothetical protein